MTTRNQSMITLTASPLRVGARLAVLAAVCIALLAGFVAGVTPPSQDPAHQVARTPSACRAPTC
jgi:hypothetical protein